MMKKGLYAILAALAVFALVMTGCDSGGGGGDDNYTVTFDVDGGAPAPGSQTVAKGGKATEPPAVTKGDNIFDGWYNGTTKWNFANDTVNSNITLKAKWLIPIIEKVTLSNANQVIYAFTLPSGKTWGDYENVTASYMLETDEEFEVENSGRAIRLYGNYGLDFFQFNETTAGTKYAYASLDGSANNNAYILASVKDATGADAGGWKTLSAALIAYFGDDCPLGGEWFTIEYKTDGSTSNQTPHPHLPVASDTGPFIFGLGLPGQGTKNTFFVKDVLLKGKSTGTADLKGSPLFISKDGYDYPAFSAYGTDGGNGEDNLSRMATQGTYPPAWPAAAPPTATITFDLNKPTAASGTPVFSSPVNFTGTKTVVKNTEQIGALPVAALTGYLFGGWAETATGTTPIATTKTFTDDASLFAIWSVDAPEGTPVAVTLNAAAITATGLATVVDQGTGYKITYDTAGSNNSYGNVHAWFTLDLATLLGAGKTIANVKAITFNFTPISGDLASKGITIIGSTEQHTWKSDTDLAAETITDSADTGTPTANTVQAVRLTINQTAANVAGPNYSIRFHVSNTGSLGGAGSATSYSITDVKLVPFQ